MPAFLGAGFFDQAGLDQGAKQIHRSLAGDVQRFPDFRRGKATLVAEQLKQLLMFGTQNQLFGRRCGDCLYSQPGPLQSLLQAFGTILQPTAQVVSFSAYRCQCSVIARPVFPVIFIDGKDVVGVEPAPV